MTTPWRLWTKLRPMNLSLDAQTIGTGTRPSPSPRPSPHGRGRIVFQSPTSSQRLSAPRAELLVSLSTRKRVGVRGKEKVEGFNDAMAGSHGPRFQTGQACKSLCLTGLTHHA